MKLGIILLALGLAACAPREAVHCNASVEREVAFTALGAHDIVTARTLGPSCDKTILVYVIASEDGHPLWAWTAPAARAFGDAFAGADAVRAFLERWASPRIERTSAAPAWPLPDGARTTLDRLTYQDIRARDLPMLCHYSGTGAETCVFWEPAAAGAGHLLDRDAPEEASPSQN